MFINQEGIVITSSNVHPKSEINFELKGRGKLHSSPNIIDIEASGFGSYSYPIEIGVVRNDGARYCRLIKPFEDWDHWQAEAEMVHHISRGQIETHGINGVQICLELNGFLGEQTVYSDGWAVDSSWINTLYARAKVAKTFKISSIEMVLTEYQMAHWHSIKDEVINDLNLTRHRASNDALIIQQTFNLSLAK